MSISSVSFMAAKPSKEIVKKAAEKAEQAVYYGKEPIGEVSAAVNKAREAKGLRASDIESYLGSRQQVIKPEDAAVDAEKIAEAYRAAHGIVTK